MNAAHQYMPNQWRRVLRVSTVVLCAALSVAPGLASADAGMRPSSEHTRGMLVTPRIVRSRTEIIRHFAENGKPDKSWLNDRYTNGDFASRSAWASSLNRLSASAPSPRLRGIFWRWVYEAYPHLDHAWSRRVQIGGHAYYENDRLFDLHRIPYPAVSYKYSSVATPYQVAGGTVAFAQMPTVKNPRGLNTSRWRMRHGMPAIAPDGTPIMVCRLFDGPHASYIEMSKARARDVIVTFLRSSLDTHCLTGSAAESYWRSRIGYFLDRYGRRLHPKSAHVRLAPWR